MILSTCWLASINYHCPSDLIDEALNRPYPVWVRGSAQVSASADSHMVPGKDEADRITLDTSPLYLQDDLLEYQAGVSEIFSYITDYYTLGTCTREFHNGFQTDSFHAIISDGTPATAWQNEISSIYTRYLINNNTIAPTLIGDCGRKLAFQHENAAMVLYSPKVNQQEVSSMKLCVLINNGFKSVREIRCAGQTLTEGSEVSADGPIFLRFKEVYCAVYPLTAGTISVLRVERIEYALSLSFIHYEGPVKHMPRKALKLSPSGFAFEIRSREEAGSFEEFINEMSGAEISDVQYSNLHTRYAVMRKASYKRGGVSLECCWSPVSEGIYYVKANGKVIV
jgi:hypothetical protein